MILINNEHTINPKRDVRIAVDGPSGAGKGELATRLAEKLGLVYLDTGALYRTVGLFAYENGVSLDDTAAIIALLDKIEIEVYRDESGTQQIKLCGRVVGEDIRRDEISVYASGVSKIPEVRSFLDKLQRDAARVGGIVMDGRDIGTVIMPDAKLKIFLTASLEVRAKRRCEQEISKGRKADYDEILARMKERDTQDSTREVAPAVASDDAIILDNSDMTIAETVDYAVELAKKVYGDLI